MKKKLIVLVTFLFVLVSILGVLVACDETEATKYTVTFKNGDTTVKTVEVEEGKSLAATDIPAAPQAPAGKEFDGWYVGSTKVEAGYKPTADVTVEAKFKDVIPETATVKFVVNGQEVKSVTVNVGATIPSNQLPSEPTAEDAGLDADIYTFAGWYDASNNKFVETAAVTASVTYTAKFDKGAVYTIKFIDGSNVTTVEVAAKASAKLAEAAIPEQAAVSGKVAQGWYTTDGVKAEADMAITANIDFYAMYVGEDDYTGAWYNAQEHVMLYFPNEGSVSTFKIGTKSVSGMSFDTETGSVTDGKSINTYTLNVVGSTLTVSYVYYDAMAEENVTETHVLVKAQAVDYAGTYKKATSDSSYIEIIDGGLVIYNGTSLYFGMIYEDGDNYKMETYASDTAAQKLYNVKIDEKGNLVVTGDVDNSYKGIYVKGSTAVSEYYTVGYGTYIYVHTVGANTVYVYSVHATSTYFYLTITDGTFADGEILTLAKDGDSAVTVTIKISGKVIELSGDEAGTYAGEYGALVLDGFGGATLNGGSAISYYTLGNIVVADGNGYEINKEAHTYTKLVAKEAAYIGTYKHNSNSYYSLILDGFGIIVEYYDSSSSHYVYYGTYTVEDGILSIEIEGDYASIKTGDYVLGDDQKVILANEKGTSVFIQEGYTVKSQINKFLGEHEGYWVLKGDGSKYLEINLETLKMNYNGEANASMTVNYNGSAFTFSFYVSGTGYFEVTVTLVDGELRLIGTFGGVPVDETFVSAEKPVEEPKEKDAIAGGYEGSYFSNTVVIYFDGYGKGIFIEASKFTEFEYKLEGTKLTFSHDGGSHEFDLTVEGDTLKGKVVEYDEYDYSVQYSRKAPDAFEGKWMPPADYYYNYELTFTGYGIVHVFRETSYSTFDKYVRYSVSDNVATFEANSDDWTCTLEGNKLHVYSQDSDGYTSVSADFTKVAEETLDALAGTWKYGSWTFEFDGKGKVTINGGTTVDYKLEGRKVTFSYDSEDWEGTLSADGETLSLSDEYGESFGSHDCKKA